MAKKIWAGMLAMVVAFALVGAGIAFGQNNIPRNVEGWEYRSENFSSTSEFIQKANRLGLDGWELVALAGGESVFKRKLP